MEVEIGRHADKGAMYAQLELALVPMLAESPDAVAALANAGALLKLFLEDVNWVGFYRMKDGGLVLGPFQGKPAVTRIPLGEGVCGTAALERRTRRVDDVHACENHITCDIASSSEIVIPLMDGDEILGVLDIDSPIPSRFDEEDEIALEALSVLLAHALRGFSAGAAI